MKYFSVAKHSIMSWFKVITLGLVLGFGLQFVQAWTAPTATPPGGNVSGPITTGSANQTKTGGFRASNISINPAGALPDTQYPTSFNQAGTLVLGNVGNLNEITTQYATVYGVLGANKVNTFYQNVWTHLYINGSGTAGNTSQVATVNGTLGANGISANALNVFGIGYATGGFQTGSDVRFKKDITNLDNSLAKTKLLQGVRYSLKTDEFPDKHFASGNQIGFIAQDVEKIFPELVETDKDGYKSIDYSKVTPVLVEAIKEQQTEIDQLKERLSDLEARMQE